LFGCADSPPNDSDEGDRSECRRHEPAKSASPELKKFDVVVLLPLPHEQIRYEKSRESEEGRDTEEATFGPLKPTVKDEHADEGKAAHAIESWEVGKRSGSLLVEFRVSE
jgi:hypothetical protein